MLLLRNTLLDDKRGALEFNIVSCILRCFDILKTLLAGERLPLPGLLPKDNNNLTKLAFHLQTNQSQLYVPPAALPESHTPSQYSPVLKHPRCQANRDHRSPQSPPELFKLASRKLFTLRCLAFPMDPLPPLVSPASRPSWGLTKPCMLHRACISRTSEFLLCFPEPLVCLLLWPHPTDQLIKE